MTSRPSLQPTASSDPVRLKELVRAALTESKLPSNSSGKLWPKPWRRVRSVIVDVAAAVVFLRCEFITVFRYHSCKLVILKTVFTVRCGCLF